MKRMELTANSSGEAKGQGKRTLFGGERNGRSRTEGVRDNVVPESEEEEEDRKRRQGMVDGSGCFIC